MRAGQSGARFALHASRSCAVGAALRAARTGSSRARGGLKLLGGSRSPGPSTRDRSLPAMTGNNLMHRGTHSDPPADALAHQGADRGPTLGGITTRSGLVLRGGGGGAPASAGVDGSVNAHAQYSEGYPPQRPPPHHGTALWAGTGEQPAAAGPLQIHIPAAQGDGGVKPSEDVAMRQPNDGVGLQRHGRKNVSPLAATRHAESDSLSGFTPGIQFAVPTSLGGKEARSAHQADSDSMSGDSTMLQSPPPQAHSASTHWHTLVDQELMDESLSDTASDNRTSRDMDLNMSAGAEEDVGEGGGLRSRDRDRRDESLLAHELCAHDDTGGGPQRAYDLAVLCVCACVSCVSWIEAVVCVMDRGGLS